MTLHGYSQEYTYAQRASKITVDVMLTDGNKDKLPSVPVATLVARYALIRSKFARDMSNASLATIMGMTAYVSFCEIHEICTHSSLGHCAPQQVDQVRFPRSVTF